MLPKMKRYIKGHKKQVFIGVIIFLIIITFLLLYKSLFYSSSEKAAYGVRIRDIKENEFTKEEINEVKEKSNKIEGVEETKIEIKGRLVKIFVTFDSSLNNEDIKSKFNEINGFISEKVKGYYDIEYYSVQQKDGKNVHSVIGYKHKSRSEITFEEL